jgi:CheY-like chemotaxis protein
MYKVLIVDDNLDNQQILGTIVKSKGYNPITVGNGEDAIDYLTSNEVDIVLLDVMMPGIDGFETCRKIKEISNTPVIFTTALSQTENIETAYKNGGDDYISKPFISEEIVARLKNQIVIKEHYKKNIKKIEKIKDRDKDDSLNLFSSSISHNFNNIFQIINGNLELISLYTEDKRIEKCIEDSFTVINRAKNILNKVTYYSGDFYSKKDRLDLEQFFNDFQKRINEYLRINSKFLVFFGDLKEINFSKDVLTEILENLVLNSIESGNHLNLKIEVEVAKVKREDREYLIDFHNEDNCFLRISVKDNGMGIKEENLRKLFDPYYSTKFIGRGMGLSLIFGIIKNFGGMVDIETEVGEGTKVSCYIPFE